MWRCKVWQRDCYVWVAVYDGPDGGTAEFLWRAVLSHHQYWDVAWCWEWVGAEFVAAGGG